MAISGKYGKINIAKIGADEPVFIIRAQDLLAVPSLEMYLTLAASHDLPLAKDVAKQIDAFRAWSGPKKMPD